MGPVAHRGLARPLAPAEEHGLVLRLGEDDRLQAGLRHGVGSVAERLILAAAAGAPGVPVRRHQLHSVRALLCAHGLVVGHGLVPPSGPCGPRYGTGFPPNALDRPLPRD